MTGVVWSHAAQDVASATRGNSGIRPTPPVPTAATRDGCGCVWPHPCTQFPGKFLGALAPALTSHAPGRASPHGCPARPASAPRPGGYNGGCGVETSTIYSNMVRFIQKCFSLVFLVFGRTCPQNRSPRGSVVLRPSQHLPVAGADRVREPASTERRAVLGPEASPSTAGTSA